MSKYSTPSFDGYGMCIYGCVYTCVLHSMCMYVLCAFETLLHYDSILNVLWFKFCDEWTDSCCSNLHSASNRKQVYSSR